MADSDNSTKSWETSQLGQYLLGAGVEELITGKNDDGTFVTTPISEFFNERDGVVGLYYSAHWCPPCRRFTPKLAEKYTSKLEGEGLTVIFVSWDRNEKAFEDYYKSEMPWAAIPYKYKDALASSDVFKSPGGIPSLYLFNKEEGLYQQSGRGAVMDGRPFPYGNPTWDDILDIVIDGEGQKVSKEKIKEKKYVGVYFSAHWCPPCRKFTPKLKEVYNNLKQNREDFEFIFVSSDRGLAQFKEYFGEMPWLALDYNSDKFDMMKSTLSDMFDVSGIPRLGVVNGSDGSIISKSAPGATADPEGKEFPWLPKPKYTFTEGELDGINDHKSIVLMMEKGNVENKQDIYQYLSAHAEAQMALKEKRVFFHFGSLEDNSIAPQIRKFTGLGDENCMVCLEFQTKSVWKAKLPTSAEDVITFANEITSGKAEKEKLR